MHYKVQKEILVATINYLQTKPYNEVAQLLQVLNGSQLCKDENIDDAPQEHKDANEVKKPA